MKKKSQKKTSQEQYSVHNQESFNNYLKNPFGIPLILVFVLVMFFSIRMISGFDIGFHLSAGRWILDNLSFPYEDTFTYTVTGERYIDVQWLFQVINYSVYYLSGYSGLIALNVILMLIVIFLIMKRLMIYGVNVFFAFLSLFVTIVSVQIRISNRPEVFTWILLLLTLIVLDGYIKYGIKRLYLLPVIMLLWVNSHGLYIIGIFLIICYFISKVFETRKTDFYFLKWSGISSAACLINPYFTEGALFPFYLFTRLRESNIFKNSISELSSTVSLSENFPLEVYLFFATAGLSLLLMLLTYKRRKLHEFIILPVFFYLGLTGFRNIAIFQIYAIYIITISGFDIFMLYAKSKDIKKNKVLKYATYVFSVVFILMCLRIYSGTYYSDYGTGIRFGAGVDNISLPEKLSDFVNENGISGHMINQLETGGWLHWKTHLPVFIDGRLEVMKEDFFEEYSKSFKVNGLKSMIPMFNPNMMIYNHSTAYQWTDELNKSETWNIAYFDGFFALYTRNKDVRAFNDILNDFILKNEIDTGINNIPTDKILEFNPVGKISKFISGFFVKQNYHPELISLGNFLLQNGDIRNAEIIYLNYLIKTRDTFLDDYHKDVFTNLGNMYLSKFNYENALKCHENILLLDAENEPVKKKADEIRFMIRSFKK